MAEYLVEELRNQSVVAEARLEHYAVHLIVRTSSGDVTVELLYPAEGIQPDSDHLDRSFTFNGLEFISAEDFIVMKLEAIRDRTEKDPETIKHKNDLLELAGLYQTSKKKLDQGIIYSEIQKREKRKQTDMKSSFHQFFDVNTFKPL